jgi:hypothetical protein
MLLLVFFLLEIGYEITCQEIEGVSLNIEAVDNVM